MKTSCRSSALLRKGGDYLNVTINRAEMLSAIKRASAVAPADSPLDVLRGALLEADAAAGKLTVTSTNLEAALEEKRREYLSLLQILPDMNLRFDRNLVVRFANDKYAAQAKLKQKYLAQLASEQEIYERFPSFLFVTQFYLF